MFCHRIVTRRTRYGLAIGLVSLTTLLPVDVASGARDVTLPPMTQAQSGPVHDIGVGGALPSEATCAARVQRVAESRPANRTYNNTRGSSPNNLYPRVTGNFVGTTDEILQWAACKWGMDPQWARAQALVESFWDQGGVPGDGGESFGILQVRKPYHGSAFEDNNAIRSTAYNADYAFENWRRCFEGHPDYAWLNQVERGRQYAAGDGLGCMGVWFAGRWYTSGAVEYMNRVRGAAVPGQTPSTTKPTAPRALDAWVAPTPGVGAGQVRLTWQAPASNGGAALIEYLVQRSSNGGATWTSVGRPTTTTFTASGLTIGHAYRFRVTARNSRGWGPFSSVVAAIPRPVKPSAPRSLVAAVAPTPGVGAGQVRLTWQGPISNGGAALIEYLVQRSSNGGATWTTIGYPKTTTFTASGLTIGHSYRFRVTVRNSAGWGPFSNIVAAVPRATTALAGAVETTTTSTAPPPSTVLPPTTATLPVTSTSTAPTTVVVTSTTAPATTTPATTAPATTAPATTTPATTAPATTAPTTTVPAVDTGAPTG